MNYKSKVLVVVLVILSMLLTSCRASCGARKARKSNKYYGTTFFQVVQPENNLFSGQ
jgi:hypothetical protein